MLLAAIAAASNSSPSLSASERAATASVVKPVPEYGDKILSIRACFSREIRSFSAATAPICFNLADSLAASTSAVADESAAKANSRTFSAVAA